LKFRFYYTGIRVRDLKRSLDFYTTAMGMKVVNKGTMPHGGKFVQLRGKGSKQTLELNWYPSGSRFYSDYVPGEEMDHLAFVVKDAVKAYKELISKGATPAVSPKESKGTEVYLKDPDGIWIELLSSG
jgi:lactoylglutathione lyase